MHTSSRAQRLPQPPQLRGSVEVFTQALPHVRVPPGQAATQAPLLHTGVAPPQLTPQPPQLFGSAEVSTHVPPQSVRPVRHTQLPPLHVSRLLHWLPHVPQLLGSLLRS